MPADGQSESRNERKASLESESSYGGKRGSALRSRGNSVDKAKRDKVWKNGSRARMASGSRNRSGGDQSQRSNGSRRSQRFSKLSFNSKERSRQMDKLERGIPNAEIRADQVQILDNPRPMSIDSNAFGSNHYPSEPLELRQRPLPGTHGALYRGAPQSIPFNKVTFG